MDSAFSCFSMPLITWRLGKNYTIRQKSTVSVIVSVFCVWRSDSLHKVDFIDMSKVSSGTVTNDEKADKFPCFKANTKEFEIKKQQNHYEITAKNADQKKEENQIINFLDVAQGLKCWKQCKPDNKSVFVGYVKIRVEISNQVIFLLLL